MKRSVLFLCLLAITSAISGILMAKASWIGRVGITFLHKELNFMKVWWQGAIGFYLVLLTLFAVLSFVRQSVSVSAARLINFSLLLLAGLCLYYSVQDFEGNFSHRLLGWRFHYGIYLFWVEWMLVCFFFFAGKSKGPSITTEDNKEIADR
jgi:hypothetical protein